MTNLWVVATIVGPALLYLTKLFYRAERPAPWSTPGVNLSAALAGVLALLLPVVLGLGAVILAEAVTVTMLAKGGTDTARCRIYVRRQRRCPTTPATVGAAGRGLIAISATPKGPCLLNLSHSLGVATPSEWLFPCRSES